LSYGTFKKDKGALALLGVPAKLAFGTVTLFSGTKNINRVDANWTLSLADTRSTSTAAVTWQLMARAPQAFTGTDGSTLGASLVFIDQSGTERPLGQTAVEIASGGQTAQQNISWDADKGLQLQVDGATAKVGVAYSTTVEWILQSAP
jgi:hypothetical protein